MREINRFATGHYRTKDQAPTERNATVKRAGVAAGIFTIAVNTGPLPDTALVEAGADLVFPDMASLYRQIDKIITYNR